MIAPKLRRSWVTLAAVSFISGLMASLVLPTPVLAQHRSKQRYQVDVEASSFVNHVTISRMPRTPSKRSETFQIVVHTAQNGVGSARVSTQQLTIPKGAVSAETELYFSNVGISYTIHIEQDNNQDYDSARDLLSIPLNIITDSSGAPESRILLASSNITPEAQTWMGGNRVRQQRANVPASASGPIPTVDQLAGYYSDVSYYNLSNTPLTPISAINAIRSVDALPVDKLPKCWRGLAPIHMIIIPFKDLKATCTSNTDIRDALREWVSIGGTLVVNDCGAKFQSAKEIKSLLMTDDKKIRVNNRSTVWNRPTKLLANFNQFISRTNTPYRGSYGPTVSLTSVTWKLPSQIVPILNSPDSSDPLITTSFARGNIIAIPDDMSSWKTKNWQVLLNTQRAFETSVTKSIGTATIANTEYTTFQIPNIGRPPVVAFQILISLFVILTGPVFYIVFKKIGRIQLLYFATPALALVACLGIILFATLKDGFKTRGRVSTVTFIDHLTDSAATHSRFAFYSGSVPNGYEFDTETLTFDSRKRFSRATRYDIGQQRTRITGGEIKARNRHQIGTVECLETQARLSFRPVDKKSIDVTNRFDTQIVYAVLHTEEGYFTIKDLDPSLTVRAARSVNDQSINRQMQKMARLHAPILDESGNQYTSQYTGFYDETSFGAGENIVRKMHSGTFLSDTTVPVGSYIAITNNRIGNASSIPQANYGPLQIHVVVGKW